MKTILTAIVVALTGLSVCVTEGAIITFDFTGTNPGQSAEWTQTSALDPNVTLSTGFSVGSVTGVNANNRFNASAWSTGSTLSAALSGSDYFGFTISVNPGFMANLNGAVIDFRLQTTWNGTSGDGPKNYAIFSSLDGFLEGNELQSGTIVGSQNLAATFGSTGYDSRTGNIEFRIYGWNAASGSGTMSANAFSLGGVVSPVPEPAEWGLICAMGLLGVCGLHTWRDRRRALRQSSSVS